jgi:Mg2+ and Co2+ transporter CorA
MGKADSADAIISTMIDEYLELLSSNERKEYEMIRDVLMMKQKK